MLEESEGQGSRLRGERQGGRHRKTGSQVRVSDGDRLQRTQDIFLNATLLLPSERIPLNYSTVAEKIQHEGTSAAATTFHYYFLLALGEFSFLPATCFTAYENSK